MYSSDQFLEHAGKQTKTKVSKKSVADLQGLLSTTNFERLVGRPTAEFTNFYRSSTYLPYEVCDEAVRRWLESMFGEPVMSGEGFPDFVIDIRSGALHGYDVKYARSFHQFNFPPSVVNSMLRGHLEVSEGRLQIFSEIVVIPFELHGKILEEGRVEELKTRMSNLLKKYPIHSIIVGSVQPNGDFVPLAHRSPLSPEASAA